MTRREKKRTTRASFPGTVGGFGLVGFFVVALVGTVTMVNDAVGSEMPESAAITVKSGEPVVIYGQRPRDCDDTEAPPFDAVVEHRVTRMPSNGTLSDGGVAERGSRSCGKNVPVRAVVYTSEPGFTGTDGVVFGRWEGIVITVEPR